MRISDVIGIMDPRPSIAIEATAGVRTVAAYLAPELELELRALGAPDDDWSDVVVEKDDTALVIVWPAAGDDLAEVLEGVLRGGKAVDALVRVLLLLPAPPEGIGVGALLHACHSNSLVIRRIHAMSYETIRTAVVLEVMEALGPLDAVRNELRVERFGAAALSARLRTAEDQVLGLAALEDEAARRLDRIRTQTDEIQRLEIALVAQRAAATTAHSKAVRAHRREKAAKAGQKVARQRARSLESSVSYRLGHTLVRLVKNPALARKAPAFARRRLGNR